MTRTTAVSIKIEASVEQTLELAGGQHVRWSAAMQPYSCQMVDGVFEGQANRAAVMRWEIEEGQSAEVPLLLDGGLDVGRGPGRDALGEPLGLHEVVLFAVRHVGGTGELVLSSPAGGPAWLPREVRLGANGILLACNPGEDGLLLTRPTAITLSASGGSVQAETMLVGRMLDGLADEPSDRI